MDKTYKLDLIEQIQKDQILNLHDEIDNKIESYNHYLTTSLKDQEDKLLNVYKQELFKAKTELQNLAQKQNETEQKKRSEEKQEQLKIERKKVIEESLKYTNKYNEFKQNLEQVQILREDIKNEVKFFDKQILRNFFIQEARQVNEKLQSDIDKLLVEIRQYDPHFQLDEDQSIWEIFPQTKEMKKNNSISIQHNTQPITSQSKQYTSPYSFIKYKNTADEQISQLQLEKQKELQKKLEDIIQDPILEPSKLESLFMTTVQQFNQKRQQKSNLPKLSTNETRNQDFFIETNYSELEQRQLLDNFLSNPEVKALIYDILSNQ